MQLIREEKFFFLKAPFVLREDPTLPNAPLVKRVVSEKRIREVRGSGYGKTHIIRFLKHEYSQTEQFEFWVIQIHLLWFREDMLLSLYQVKKNLFDSSIDIIQVGKLKKKEILEKIWETKDLSKVPRIMLTGKPCYGSGIRVVQQNRVEEKNSSVAKRLCNPMKEDFTCTLRIE